MYSERKRELIALLNKKVKKGFPEWAKLHVERLIYKADYFRTLAKTERYARNYERACDAILQAYQVVAAFR